MYNGVVVAIPYLKREWTPHPAQRSVLDDTTRHRVVAAGRRFGKTRMARAELIESGFETPNGYSWFVAPTATDAKELGFDPMRNEIPDRLLDGGWDGQKESSPQEIYLTNGHRYQFRGAGVQGRGRGLDLVVIDEAGEQTGSTWEQVIRPSLLDTGGRALIIGTPKGRDWFYKLHARGRDSTDDEVAAFQFTSYDNPHIPDADIEAERATMPERVFKQEYLAEFLEDEGAVFGNVRERNARPYHVEDVTGSAPYASGVDLARKSDYLVAATLDADGMLVGFLRDRGFSWAAARRRLTDYLSAFPGECHIDASRDNSVVEDVANAVEDVHVEAVNFTSSRKANMVENLAARLETEDIVLPLPSTETDDTRPHPWDALYHELESFQYDASGRGVSYSAPEGEHDDTVDALALAAEVDPAPASMAW